MHRVVAALVGLVSIGVTACVMSGPKYRKNIHKPKLTDYQRREAVARREAAKKPSPRSGAATTSAAGRFRGSRHERNAETVPDED